MNSRCFAAFSKNVCTDRCCMSDRYGLSTLDYRSVKPINIFHLKSTHYPLQRVCLFLQHGNSRLFQLVNGYLGLDLQKRGKAMDFQHSFEFSECIQQTKTKKFQCINGFYPNHEATRSYLSDFLAIL